MDAALLFFGFLWALLGGKSSSSSSTPSSSPSTPRATPSTPPWPLVVPPDLPRFPGAAWEYDEPPPRAVQQRAAALLDVLWALGSGASKTEQTAGRWITYRAEIVRSGKRGVVAYRLRRAQPAPAPAPSVPMAPPEAVARRSTPSVTPASFPAGPLGVVPLPARAIEMPTLRFGAGLRPAAPVQQVKLLQQRLGLSPDGRFGNDTRAAVVRFQQSQSLQADGIVGPKTWSALFAVTNA